MLLSISNDYLTDFHVAQEPKCALVVAGEFWRRLPPSKIENDHSQLN